MILLNSPIFPNIPLFLIIKKSDRGAITVNERFEALLLIDNWRFIATLICLVLNEHPIDNLFK